MNVFGWPLEMRADRAAAYCDEPSPETFLRLVSDGVYPQPVMQSQGTPKWHRRLLDAAIDRLHGLAAQSATGEKNDGADPATSMQSTQIVQPTNNASASTRPVVDVASVPRSTATHALTMQQLVDHFRNSEEYRQCSAQSRRAYDRYLRVIENRFGTMVKAELEDTRTRGIFKAFRATFSSTPRKADYVWTTLSRVLSVGKDHGLISGNICERGGRLYEVDRSDRIWKSDDICAFCDVASSDLRAAMLLALWTGQRQGDLLRLTWKNYDGTHLRLRQTKARGGKGRRVVIPLGGPLKVALETAQAHRRSAATILTNSRGLPWTADGFRTSWGKAFDRTGLRNLHFHDLRGTAVTRLALVGCTVPEIASLTGHALTTVQDILDAHYLGGRVELAEAAIKKLNAVYG